MDLEWLWDRLSADETDLVRRCMNAFEATSPDRNQLMKLTADLQELEKRFVSLNPTQEPAKELLARVLVCSVGFRPLPVVLSAILLQPTKLYLLHSQESRPMAEQVRDDPYVQALGLHPERDIVLRTISLVNAPENYGHLNRIVKENSGARLVIDISGGVKVMGVSLASAAFWLRIPVVYQLGEETNGVIRPFSEQLTEVQNPFVYFGSTELRSLQDLFRVGEYDAALALLQNLRDTIGDATTLARIEILEEFVQIYRDWDAFIHSQIQDSSSRRLATRLRVVLGKLKRFGMNFAEGGRLQQNLSFLNQIDAGWIAGERNNSEPYRLVDVFASARRRALAGKYDDAVGRLYRCLEMAATICLLKDWGIGDAAKPDFTKLAAKLGGDDNLRSAFRKRARYDLPDRLGLKDQMTLLMLTNAPRYVHMAAVFTGIESSGLMEARNRSTLAHGTVAVSESEYRQFEKKVTEILRDVFSEGEQFEVLLNQATHPEIHVEF